MRQRNIPSFRCYKTPEIYFAQLFQMTKILVMIGLSKNIYWTSTSNVYGSKFASLIPRVKTLARDKED